ncbi:MAG TPA: S46 family peptidase [Longimicrobiales bacterium]|nr:S46 family peptidase [Longimicrobiales bacterium]
MWRRHTIISTVPLLAGLVLAACATAPAASDPQPGAVTRTAGQMDSRLDPSDAARRAAAGMQPTGLELGTMWTFENPPLEYWRERYGFNATPEWLEHARLASVRYGRGCSASFVSPDGLVMTNHHCAQQCIEDVSTADVDHIELGFHARTRDEERVCPNLFLDQLVDIADVTERVRAAAPAGGTSEEVTAALAAESRRIQQECEARTGNTCQVVPLYQGGQHQLYTYRRYAPVKLVFAPEVAAGFFGGDPDNFTYPRYALDVTFVRAYADDGVTPVSSPHYFPWRAEGAAEDELVFVTGNPGSTSRLITLAQMMYERSYRHPFIVDLLAGRLAMLKAIAAQGPEQERQVRQQIFGVENSLKAYSGQLAGLTDSMLVAQKIAWERDLRQRVEADPEARRYADVWDRLVAIQVRKLALDPLVNVSSPGMAGAQHLVVASQLAGFVHAATLAEADRPAAYRGERFEQARQALARESAVPEAQAVAALAFHLRLAAQWLPADHPAVRARTAGETPEEAALRLIRASPVAGAAWRQGIIAAGPAAADTVSDPLFRLARAMDSIYGDALPQLRALTAEETVQRERLARALFAVHGTRFPPDATFTLRIADGIVAGYPYNGTVAPYKTTYYGLYARAAEFDDRDPWTLPKAFAERRDSIDMTVPINFVSTNDITGGNSGSPMIDREGRIVGIAFDGNIEQLPNEFVFRTENGRTVGVHSAGILEALRSVYQAHALVSELLGSSR